MSTGKGKTLFSKLPTGSGFTLLYAIIILGLVLFITTAAFYLISRQILFTTISNDSEDAFYAAESGGECILSYAQKGIFDKKIIQDITCDGLIYRTNGAPVQTFTVTVSNPTNSRKTVAIVTVDTTTRTIQSVGYNSPDTTLPNRVERAITFKYKSYCPIGGDVMLIVDLSGSISPQELIDYKKSLSYFVNTIFTADSATRVGLVAYGTAPKLLVHLTGSKSTLLSAINNLDIAGFDDGVGRGTNTPGGLTEALYEFQGKEEISSAFDRTKIPMGTMNDWERIMNPVGGYNRDDAEFFNYYVLFTDGAANGLMPKTPVEVNGKTVRPGEFVLDVCDTNPLTTGCGGTGTTMQSFLDAANTVKNNGTLFIFGIAIDDSACTTHACSWYLKQAATKPEFVYTMPTFDSFTIDSATNQLLSCTR